MLGKDTSHCCELHPDVRVLTQEERIQFRLDWDAKVEANRG